MPEPAPPQVTPTAPRAPHRPLGARALAGVALAAALVPLGSTMIAVALVDVAGDLGARTADATWLITAYLAAMVVAQPLGGRLGDRLGHRRVFAAGLAVFLAACALAAAAPTLPALVALRVVQAAAGGLVLPNASALILHGTSVERRGRAFGLLASTLALAAALGPVAGGAVVEWAGWRALFLVPIVPGIAAAVLAAGAPETGPAERRAGAATSPRAAIAVLARRSAFVRPALTIGLHNMVLYTALVLVPLIAHDALGMGHGAAGALVGALTIGLLAGAVAGGRLADHRGRRAAAVIGSLPAAVGAAALAAVVRDPATAALAAALVVTGAGIGAAGPALQAAALEAAPPGTAAVAGGLYMSVRYAGGIAASLLAGGVADLGVIEAGFVVAALAATAAVLAAAGLPGGRPVRVRPGRRAG